MIIDMHNHLIQREWLSERYWKARYLDTGKYPDIDQIPSTHATPEALLDEMDKAGVEKSVVLPFVLGTFYGKAECSTEEILKTYGVIGEKYTRLIPFASLDPRHEAAVELLVKGVEEWGLNGFKAFTNLGLYADDPSFYPIYEKCQEFEIPVTIHTGLDGNPFRGKYGVPINVDSVAVDFPELTLILAHAGMGLFEQATTVAVVHPNVYLELSYLQGYLKKAPAYFFRTLRNFIDLVSKEKILFGTDWPGAIVSHGMTMAEWVHQLKSLSESAKPFGIDFTQDEVDAIMGQNAARILKL